MTSYSLLALFSVLALVSCKKGGDAVADYGQGTGWCRIKGLTSSSRNASPGVAQIQYNSDGRIAALRTNSRVTSFSYSNNNIYVTLADTLGGVLQVDTITYEGSRITAIASGGLSGHYRTTFFYDGNGQLTHSRSTEYSNVREEFLAWSNGDVVSDSTVMNGKTDEVSHFAYYTDKTDQYASPVTGDFFYRYGMPLYQTKHLVKSADYGSNGSYAFAYIFDKDNKVTTATSVPSYNPDDTLTTVYSYECK
jgi:hypothetical protein